jgi:hypothetical protein
LELSHHQLLLEIETIFLFPQIMNIYIAIMEKDVKKKFYARKFFLTKEKNSLKRPANQFIETRANDK